MSANDLAELIALSAIGGVAGGAMAILILSAWRWFR